MHTLAMLTTASRRVRFSHCSFATRIERRNAKGQNRDRGERASSESRNNDGIVHKPSQITIPQLNQTKMDSSTPTRNARLARRITDTAVDARDSNVDTSPPVELGK